MANTQVLTVEKIVGTKSGKKLNIIYKISACLYTLEHQCQESFQCISAGIFSFMPKISIFQTKLAFCLQKNMKIFLSLNYPSN